MERIIRQLMDFARPVKPVRGEIRVNELVQSSLAQIDPELERHQVEILPVENGADLHIHGDRLRLEQALINLLRNAIQAASGGQLRLSWQAGVNGGLSITVEDTGTGVELQNVAHILEPFFTTKPVGVGTGLGLAVVNAVMNEHGGRIEIGRSELGGALFRMWLPAGSDKEVSS